MPKILLVPFSGHGVYGFMQIWVSLKLLNLFNIDFVPVVYRPCLQFYKCLASGHQKG